MATKPSDTVPIWASNANWSAGPSAGSPTKADPTPYAANGHIEGVATPSRADVMNGWQNPVSKWCQWVEAGSSAGAADAHIVETASDGTTNLKGLVIDGTGTAAIAALYVQQNPTASGAYIASAGATVKIAQDNIGVDVGGGDCDAFYAHVTGDHVPWLMNTQTTSPTSFVTSKTPLFSVRGTFSGNTSTVLCTAVEATKEYIPSYENQHVRAVGYANNDTATTSESTVVASTSWPNRKALQASTPILVSFTYYYDNISAPMNLTIRIKKGASTVNTTIYPIGSAADTSGSHSVRVLVPSEPSGSVGGYSVTAQTSTGTVDLYYMALTLETSV